MAAQFIFINSTDPYGTKDCHMRSQIRQQAMRSASSLRRQRDKSSKQNLRQYPVFLFEDRARAEEVASDTITGHCPQMTLNGRPGKTRSNEEDETNEPMAVQPVLPPPIRSSGYERMRICLNFDVLDLSALTTFHVGRLAAQMLCTQPYRMSDVLRCRQWSYFLYLPRRYGHSEFLDAAIHCVAARMRHFVTCPLTPLPPGVVRLYATALEKLQKALDDPVMRLEPDVLCATEVLAVYELLDFSNTKSWARHMEGATALVKLRGPNTYATDFERALFIALTGPMFTEAIVQNRRCFFDNDAWRDALRSAILDTASFADCSVVAINLWITVSPLPHLYQQVQSLIGPSSNPTSSTSPSQTPILVAQILTLRTALLTWRAQHLHLTTTSALSVYSLSSKSHELLGVCIASLITANRLLTALTPLLAFQQNIETESQALARELVGLEDQAVVKHPRAALFIVFQLRLARATVETGEQWAGEMERVVGEGVRNGGQGECIRGEIFGRWAGLKEDGAVEQMSVF